TGAAYAAWVAASVGKYKSRGGSFQFGLDNPGRLQSRESFGAVGSGESGVCDLYLRVYGEATRCNAPAPRFGKSPCGGDRALWTRAIRPDAAVFFPQLRYRHRGDLSYLDCRRNG